MPATLLLSACKVLPIRVRSARIAESLPSARGVRRRGVISSRRIRALQIGRYAMAVRLRPVQARSCESALNARLLMRKELPVRRCGQTRIRNCLAIRELIAAASWRDGLPPEQARIRKLPASGRRETMIGSAETVVRRCHGAAAHCRIAIHSADFRAAQHAIIAAESKSAMPPRVEQFKRRERNPAEPAEADAKSPAPTEKAD